MSERRRIVENINDSQKDQSTRTLLFDAVSISKALNVQINQYPHVVHVAALLKARYLRPRELERGTRGETLIKSQTSITSNLIDCPLGCKSKETERISDLL